MRNKLYRIGIVFLATILSVGCSVPKAFEALEVYNYFQAKKHFEKAEKKQPVIAKYGLSVIQQRTDNPFFNIDTAHQNITYAVVNFDSLSIKKIAKYSELGVTKSTILEHQKLIAGDMFSRSISINTEEEFQSFIEKNATSSLVPKAIFYRDSLFFESVVESNKAEGYQSFMDKYPTSYYHGEALQRYERQLYAEETEDDKLINYINFLTNYPENPFAIDAENQIYRIETETGTVSNYEMFIQRHPDNRNIRDAWGKLYDAYLTENLSESAISEFIEAYPNNPFKNDIESDLSLSKTVFYPVQKNGKWGYKSEMGEYSIDGEYEFAEPFHEGLAIVVKNDKVGFITKSGVVKIDFKFDDALPFSEGTAVVEYGDKYGLINRQGVFIISPEFDYLGALKDGLIPFEHNGKFGYFDSKGKTKIEAIFDNAYNFKNNIALVSINSKWGIINNKGEYLFDPNYSAIYELNDTVFALYYDDFGGAISLSKDTVLDFVYNDMAPASNDFYLVTKRDSFNYINSTGQLLLKDSWQPVYPEYKILAKYDKNPILVLTNEGYNYMELDGKFVFKKAKKKLGDYSNLIAFEKDGLWGYLTPFPAKEIIEPKFDKALSFKHGFGIVSLAPFLGTITGDGNFMIDAYYEELEFLTSDALLAKGKGDYGLLNVFGDTILPFSNAKIEPFTKNTVKVSGEGSVSYYNYISESWIRKEE